MTTDPHKQRPANGQLAHVNHRRDTAERCRDKAKDNLLLAVQMPGGDERTLLERSAAAWSIRAGQLERQETRLAPQLTAPEPAAYDAPSSIREPDDD
jgi:hypothetical protein